MRRSDASMPPSTIGTSRKRLARAVRVDDGRAIGPHVARAAGRVLILAADLLLRGELVEHRVEVAGGDAEEEARLAERAERLDVAPIGLRDEADLEAAPFEEARDRAAARTPGDRRRRRPMTMRMSSSLQPRARTSAIVTGRNGCSKRARRSLVSPVDIERSKIALAAASCTRRRGSSRAGRGSCRCPPSGRPTSRCCRRSCRRC